MRPGVPCHTVSVCHRGVTEQDPTSGTAPTATSAPHQTTFDMDCHYINLDHAVERRASLETNFSLCRRPGWALKRYAAMDEATTRRDGVPGKRSWREKACFLSHKGVIETHVDKGSSFMVLEDDAQFGLCSLEIIESILANNTGTQWDLLFTAVSVLQFNTMLLLATQRSQLLERRQVLPLDLAKIPFVGATAYVVNGASRQKLLDYLATGVPVDIEYDVYLYHGIAAGHLKAAVLFPFVTTLSKHSTQSQIQPAQVRTSNLARDVFRRMMWLESSPDSYSADLAHIESKLRGSVHGTVAMLAGAQHFEDQDQTSSL